MNKPITPKQIVRNAGKLLKGKSSDYGARGKNFKEAALVASVIRGKDIDAMDVAAALLGVKLSRFGNLTTSGKEPANEAILDTAYDAINYVALLEELRQLGVDY